MSIEKHGTKWRRRLVMLITYVNIGCLNKISMFANVLFSWIDSRILNNSGPVHEQKCKEDRISVAFGGLLVTFSSVNPFSEPAPIL